MFILNRLLRGAARRSGLYCALLFAACGPGAAQASAVTAGPVLTVVPGALFDPLGTLSLTSSQFLVPVQVRSANALESWQFGLHFNAAVAAPTDVGGLFQSVYQADFGSGAISQITSSGLLLADTLEDVSGYFAPAVSGDGLLAYLL